MKAHRGKSWLLVLVVLGAAVVGATKPANSAASLTPVSGTTTCTFDPHADFTAVGDGLNAAKTICVVWHFWINWDDTPVCQSGRLIQFGIGHVDTLSYLYAGRAIAPGLNGVTVPTYDLTAVVLPGARLLTTSFSYGHNGPTGRDVGAC